MNNAILLSTSNADKFLSRKEKLSDVSVGRTCRVRSLNAKGLLKNRMLDIGIIPGTEIKVIRTNATGDTTAYLIRGALIALRKEESSLVDVTRS